MPKRSPTPPSTDDSQFLTVVNPYPDQPYEALEHSIIFARWIACVIGEENLLAFYHKPKSPNVVIIEVSKEGFNLRRLLGKHRWSEMLKKPNKEEAAQVSSVFPCKKNTGWSLEKIRWLRRDVESSWFKNWSPADDKTFTYPYPDSYFCDPPAEDVTGTRLCCPLPREMFTVNSVPAQPPTCRSATAASPQPSDCCVDNLPLPPGLPVPHFVPAIHGTDVPKADRVAVAVVATPPVDATLWSGYGEPTDRAAQDDLCAAHNVLCHRGICKLCAARKRAEIIEERARERQREKEVWAQRRKGRGGRPQSQTSRGTSSDASSSSRSGSPEAVKASPGDKAEPTNPRVDHASAAGRTLPAHLRKGGNKADTTSSGMSVSPPSSSCSPSSGPTTDDGESTTSSSSESASSKSESDSSSPPSPHVPVPWARTFNAWHTHAKLPAEDASSVASGKTRDAFRNPWRRMAPVQAARPRWGAAVSDFSPRQREFPRVLSGGDDDEESVVSEYDEEPF
ncbi:hypothetical protein K466DRAFT_606790 [Polyporus arcularius HHB13444]|uniref:Uncharacterized protein n=1 Tax=Polyporus arcularius HHB13444 TaxID=1314778 RepID=A0A5C3NNR1_9APHY|nr:hypothetical protein K466DRAFT_606790 [Polyporus arcularius HHB13444]